MCFHKWTKWEQYTIEFKNKEGKVVVAERRQRKHCTKCNKEDNEFITSY